jgi:hypothetical protein
VNVFVEGDDPYYHGLRHIDLAAKQRPTKPKIASSL